MKGDKEDIYRLVDRHLWENYPFSDRRLLIQKPLAYLFQGGSASEKWSKENVDKLLNELEERYSDGEYWLCRYMDGMLSVNGILLVTNDKIEFIGLNSEDKELKLVSEISYEGLKIRTEEKSLYIENGIEGERLEVEFWFNDPEESNEAENKILEYTTQKNMEKIRGRWISRKNTKEFQQALKSINEGFRHFTPTEFEYFIAYLFKEKGFDVEVTQQSNDYGVDVIAEDEGSKIAIQVKRKKLGNNVGSKTVRESLGSLHKYNADKALIVTSSSFTNPAIEQGKNSPINLWDREILKDEIRKVIL